MNSSSIFLTFNQYKTTISLFDFDLSIDPVDAVLDLLKAHTLDRSFEIEGFYGKSSTSKNTRSKKSESGTWFTIALLNHAEPIDVLTDDPVITKCLKDAISTNQKSLGYQSQPYPNPKLKLRRA